MLTMNKRITELHNQTMYWVADNGGLRISDRIPTGYVEKLAELIVRECANIANKGLDPNEEYLIGDDILKHFGVEE